MSESEGVWVKILGAFQKDPLMIIKFILVFGIVAGSLTGIVKTLSDYILYSIFIILSIYVNLFMKNKYPNYFKTPS